CNYFFADFYFGEDIAQADFVHYPEERWFPAGASLHPELLDDAKLREFYFPEAHGDVPGLIDLNSGNADRGICALPLTRVADARTIWFPVNLIGNLYVSNGMSAGNNRFEARVQALSEILERAAKFTIIREQICLPDIPEQVIGQFPLIRQGIEELRASGFGILVKDASLGGRFPVVNITLLNPRDQGCYASFGAHPRFEIALERALTELLQGRALDKLDGFPPPDLDTEAVSSAQNLETHFIDSSGVIGWRFLHKQADHEFTPWDFSGDSETEFNTLCGLIHALGHDIYIADLEHLGVYVCRILVPELSEIYPADDLVWENNNEGLVFRERILTLQQLTPGECAALLDELASGGYDEQYPIAQLIGIAPEPGTLWEELRLGELKTLLAIRAERTDEILDGCDWLTMFAQINPQRLQIYRCIAALLQLDEPENYLPGLQKLFDEKTLQSARDLLDHKTPFLGLESPGTSLKGFELHGKLIQALRKLRAVM
ncbi:MAG: YcaO-like family protein, partial [Gammaproteobacteria bacterium]|nr:YcaO-like family protein [Gammaproteobacteria bacterium]